MDKPLDELLDTVIEIPQALLYLFHAIHDQKSPVGKEEAVIRYWMKNKSFEYLYHLKNNFAEATSVTETILATDSIINYTSDTQRNNNMEMLTSIWRRNIFMSNYMT